MLAVFLSAGLILSAKSGFFQITGIHRWFGGTVISAFRDKDVRQSRDSASISQTGALSSALAACLGTGNIVGVATALAAGGAGAVFWMCLSAILGMMTCCCENILGIKYRIRDERGDWLGGAMLYIERGLGMKGLAKVFCVFLVGSSIGMGNMTQANSVSASLAAFGVKPMITGIILSLLTFAIISGGIKRIAAFAEKLIPALSAIFMLASFTVIAVNRRSLPACLKLILKQALSKKGVAGFGMAKAARYGVARGVFSNEAGLGSSPIIHAAADTDSAATQGYWGMLEVFIDTVFMCTVTALAILTSGAGEGKNGIDMSAAAFASVFGSAGDIFIRLCVVLFAFATIASWSYYGKVGTKYLLPDSGAKFYNVIYVLAAFAGCVVKLESVWSLSDTLNGLMAVPNLFAVVLLSKEAITILKSADTRKRRAQ